MPRKVMSLAAAALLFLQCRPVSVSRAIPVDPVIESGPAEAAPQADDSGRSSLSADTLRPGNPVMLRLSAKHPERLAITDPDGRYYYIQDPGTTQLMEATAFAKAREIRIDAEQNGLYYDDGKARSSGVFTKSGVYTLYLADNLETEEENTNALRLNFWFISKR